MSYSSPTHQGAPPMPTNAGRRIENYRFFLELTIYWWGWWGSSTYTPRPIDGVPGK